MTATTDRESFLASRRTGIGGTDAASIVGAAGAYRTPLDVWRSKVLGDDDDAPSPEAEWGTLLEPAMRAKAEKTLEAYIEGPERVEFDGWRIANLDGRVSGIWAPSSPCVVPAVVELKTAHWRIADRWAETAGPDDILEVTGDEIPENYLAQTLWYLDVTGFPQAFVCVLIGGSDFRIYRVPAMPAIQAAMRETCARFWCDNVIGKLAPDPVTIEDVKKRWRHQIVGSTKPAAPVLDDLERLATLKRQAKDIQQDIERAQFAVRAYAEDAEALVNEHGSPVVTLKTVKKAGHVVGPCEYRDMRFTKWWNKRNGGATNG